MAKIIKMSTHQVFRLECQCGCQEIHIDIDENEHRAYMSCAECGRIWQDGEAISGPV